jgi:hypothetical protein
MSDSDFIGKGVRLFRVYHHNGEVINREIDVDEYITERESAKYCTDYEECRKSVEKYLSLKGPDDIKSYRNDIERYLKERDWEAIRMMVRDSFNNIRSKLKQAQDDMLFTK